MKFSVCAAVLCLVLTYASAELLIGPTNQYARLQQTTAVMLKCQTTPESVSTSQVQWWEYGTNPSGAQISDQNVLLPSHPNVLRYFINTTLAGQFDLFIIQPEYVDGTYYQCIDASEAPPNTYRLGAQLVVIEGDPRCSTTLLSSTVIEGDTYTMECNMTYNATNGVDPLMTWTGPEPFIPAYNVGNNSVWSGIRFTVERTMDAQSYTCKTNFTQKGFELPDSDNTVPNYEYQWRSPQLLVNWPPKNMRYEPDLPSYSVGSTLVGFADAFPAATYYWQGLWGPAAGRTWNSQSFQIDSSLIGNNTFRFHAENIISGIQYYNDIFPNIYVNPIPTTPSPGPSTTTTAPPARANCGDLTGKWTSTNPTAILCISVDYTTNGVISGTFKNGTDTYYSTVYGRIQLNTFDQGGFTLINGLGNGVFSFVLECQACFGVETMIVSSIQNSAQSIATCGSTGVSNVIPDYYFTRVSNKPICVG